LLNAGAAYRKLLILNVLKKLLLTLLLFTGSVLTLLAQDRQIQGIVFDNITKQRLSRVYIYDTRTHKGIYNNIKGEFTMDARQGDTLIVALQGYAIDTVTVKSQSAFIFYLVPTSILLKEVVITDSVLTPDKKLEQVQKEYREIYRIGNSKDLLTVGSGGVGVGIDAIYSLLSREGKNARHLQKIIESDYRDAIIDYRFTQTLVNNVTGLSGGKLKDFMLQYRPNYYFVLEANEYTFAAYIKANYARYVEDPAAFRLPSLK
jgi:hypothetical protein